MCGIQWSVSPVASTSTDDAFDLADDVTATAALNGQANAQTGSLAVNNPSYIAIPGSSNVEFSGTNLSDMQGLSSTGTSVLNTFTGQSTDGSVLGN